MKVTPVYLKTLKAAQNHRIVCSEGGSRSSKTWSIFQYFLVKALSGEKFDVTIIREKLTWIKETLLKDFEEMTTLYGIKVEPSININRPQQVYRINQAIFDFWGLDDPTKAHGKKQTYFWVNEAMEIRKKEFDQIEMRTTAGGIIDYNPSDDSHWVFDLQRREDVAVVKSTMLDNPFLESAIKRKIKSYEPTEKNLSEGTADSYMWEVYGLGNKAKLQGLVFENWDLVDSIPEFATFKGYGLDFGYTNDPTALVEVYMSDGEIYVNEMIYETGLTNQDILRRLETLQVNKSKVIYAESSEPKSIEEISRGGYYILPVSKGPDSINFGIGVLKGFKVHITKRSINLDRERRRYKWAEDRNGRNLNEPIDDFNHAIDALRYHAMMALATPKEVNLRWL